MARRIVTQHPTKADLFRHLAQVFLARATDRLKAGQDPTVAAELAAEYSTRATALDPAVTR